ncbi:MAG: carbamoyltransferase family protein [Pseudonocardiaceae bacterium]
MNILGINGWPGASHDAAACLLIDGTIIACTEEERFIRRKHAYGAAPHNAVASCLHQAGLRFEDIDVIAHGWDMPELLARRNVAWPGTDAEVMELLFPSKLFPRTRDPQLIFVNHHLAHAASAYYLSGLGRASIMVLDGQGENESTTLATGIDGKITPVRSVCPSWSLGYFYDAVCQYSGLGAATAGKLMGLAPHGRVREEGIAGFRHTDNGYELDIIPEELISVGRTDEEQDTVTRWLEHLAQVLPDPPNTGATPHYDPLRSRLCTRPQRDPFEYRDLAATAQDVLERCVIAMAKDLLSSTGERFLTVAGGVGFNATLNGKLARLPEVGGLFVQPLAGDQGVALGAAVNVAIEAGETVAPMTGTIAWGPSYSSDDIRTVLDRSGVAYTQSDDIATDTAQLLERGAVVGWHQGRSEVGPRALGQRSMLVLPQPEFNRDRINVTIKDREPWRPFAPSLHEEAAKELLGLTEPLPYMIVTTPMPEEHVASLAAVVHVDGTTRPQTVSRQTNPLYHDLLTEVQRRTGVPVVLNTSFNGRDEPIVGSPSDALATFYGCPMDALAIGPFLIRKGMVS